MDPGHTQILKKYKERMRKMCTDFEAAKTGGEENVTHWLSTNSKKWCRHMNDMKNRIIQKFWAQDETGDYEFMSFTVKSKYTENEDVFNELNAFMTDFTKLCGKLKNHLNTKPSVEVHNQNQPLTDSTVRTISISDFSKTNQDLGKDLISSIESIPVSNEEDKHEEDNHKEDKHEEEKHEVNGQNEEIKRDSSPVPLPDSIHTSFATWRSKKLDRGWGLRKSNSDLNTYKEINLANEDKNKDENTKTHDETGQISQNDNIEQQNDGNPGAQNPQGKFIFICKSNQIHFTEAIILTQNQIESERIRQKALKYLNRGSRFPAKTASFLFSSSCGCVVGAVLSGPGAVVFTGILGGVTMIAFIRILRSAYCMKKYRKLLKKAEMLALEQSSAKLIEKVLNIFNER